jgi:hypothetical protein
MIALASPAPIVPKVRPAPQISANEAAFVGAHASMDAAVADSTSRGGDAGTSPVVWHSSKDVSLHGQASVKLPFTPSDVHGAAPTFTITLTISNLRSAARRVNYPSPSYGGWDAAAIMSAERYDLASFIRTPMA